MIDSIAHILISPINQSILGIGIGAALLGFTKVKPWFGKCLIWFSVIWVALCSQYFFSYWLIEPLEKAFPPIKVQSKQLDSANAMWVLACYHFDAKSLPLVSQFNHCSIERLVHAASIYRVKPMPIYLTGGNFNSNTTLNHANQASKLLLSLGVSSSDINLLNQGSDTISEAKELFLYIQDQKLAVISSATHGIRLARILKNSNIDFIFVPVHYETKGENAFKLNIPSTSALLRSEKAFYEYAALVKHWLRQ